MSGKYIFVQICSDMEFTICAIRVWLSGILLCMLTGRVAGQTDTIHQDTVGQCFLTLRGHVAGGEEKELLPGAYIYLGEKQVPVMTTDRDGVFIIPRLRPGKIRLGVSYIGFQNFSEEYDVREDLDVGEILLKSVVLDEVEVKTVLPLALQRGDTTQFNAAALKVAADADLEALLKKLPGFEIVDGKIMAQGKEVKKLYIDGMEYSFNAPAAALKNLPAKLVDKIKMYDDRSEEAKFSGYDDGQKFRTLNIQTHEPDKMKIFGMATTGYGVTIPPENMFKEKNYQGTLSGNFFDRKRKITVAGDVNSTGQNNDLPGSDYKGKGSNNSHSVFANVSVKLGEKTDFSGNYHYSGNNSYAASLSKQEYFPTDRYENRIYDAENHSWGIGSQQSLNLHTDIRLNENNRISLSPVFSASRDNRRSLSFGSSIENNDTISSSGLFSRDKNNSIHTGAEILWMHAFPKKGRTFTLRFGGNYDENTSDELQNNQERSLNSENVYADTLRNLMISNRRGGYSWNTSFSWSEPLTEHARLGFNYAYRENTEHTDQKSLTYKDREFRELAGIDTAQTNELRNSYRIHSYGANYNYFQNKIRLNGGLSLSHTRMSNRYKYLAVPDSLIKSMYINVTPLISAGVKMGANSNLDFSYRGYSSSPDARQLQDLLDVSNPMQIFRGNPALRKSYHHSVAFTYARSFPEKSVFWNAALSGGQTFNQMASNVKFIQRDTVIRGYAVLRGVRLTTPVNLNGNWDVSARVDYSFPWEKLKLRFNTALSYRYSRVPSIYDDLKNETNAHSAGLRLNINTNISENIDFYLSSDSDYTYSRNTTTGGTQNFNENVNVYGRWIFWKGWFISSGYAGTFYVNKKGETVNQTRHLLNVQLGKKFGKDKNIDIAVLANDVLNQQNTINYTVNDLYTETSYHTMPSSCYFLVVSYHFNNVNKPKQ